MTTVAQRETIEADSYCVKTIWLHSSQQRNNGKTTARILPLGSNRYQSASIVLRCVTLPHWRWLV